jgi:hypothetical protein
MVLHVLHDLQQIVARRADLEHDLPLDEQGDQSRILQTTDAVTDPDGAEVFDGRADTCRTFGLPRVGHSRQADRGRPCEVRLVRRRRKADLVPAEADRDESVRRLG